MVCDADTVINLNRESSKTRLMGMNVHPSRKTEVEKKDETEELITIKNNSRNSSCSSTISQSSINLNLNNSNNSNHSGNNNNDSMHSALVNQMNYSSSDLLSSPSSNNSKNNNNNVSNDSMSNNKNDSIKNIENNEKNNNITENNKNQNNSLLSVLSISSNLNLLEGDLPQTMLENFDIPCGPITPSIATVVMNVLKQGGKLSFKSAHKILRISYKFLSELPNTTHCVVGPEDRLTVVGDLHGKLLFIYLLSNFSLFLFRYSPFFLAFLLSFFLPLYFSIFSQFIVLLAYNPPFYPYLFCLHFLPSLLIFFFYRTTFFTFYHHNYYHFYVIILSSFSLSSSFSSNFFYSFTLLTFSFFSLFFKIVFTNRSIA